jgi:hypothetical protein
MDLRRKVFQAPNNELQLGLQRRFILELLGLGFEGCEALLEAGNAGCTFRLRHEPLGITVDPPGKALPQLANLGVERRWLLPLGPTRGLHTAAIFLRAALRMGAPAPHCLPDRPVQEIGADLRIVTDARAPKAVGLGAETAIRGIGPGGPLGSLATHRLPVQGSATLVALPSALQQVPRTTARVARVALVLLEWRLDRGTQLRLPQSRDRNGEPLVGGHIPDRDGTPGLAGAVALRPSPRAQGDS